MAVSSTDKAIVTLSLMWMQHARQRGNAHCPAILRCLLQNADSMQSVPQATEDASAVR